MTDEVITRIENGLGRITLNRPQALHALTTEMCAAMAEALTAWEHDPAVRAVVVDHTQGTRGFCAGGDIRKVAESGRGDGLAADDFFRVEYTLNAQIKHYPKPYIALMDGITMGGGVGIAMHGSHRIATDKTIFAMPETGIGLFPDVGGGWFLPRLDGELGTWLALTGARLRGSEAKAAGIATHYVPVIDMCKAELLAGGDIDAVLAKHARPAPEPAYTEQREIIDRCFGKDSMTDICLALKLDDSDWAEAQGEILARRSPLSCCVALKQLRLGRSLTDFDDVMRMEYRIACHITRSNDFSEGVRAVIEDKDNAPRWRPETLAGVTPGLLDAMFAPVAHELEL